MFCPVFRKPPTKMTSADESNQQAIISCRAKNFNIENDFLQYIRSWNKFTGFVFVLTF